MLFPRDLKPPLSLGRICRALAGTSAILLEAVMLPASAQPVPSAPFAHPAMAEWRRSIGIKINRTARLLGKLSVGGETLIGLRIDRSGRLIEAKVLRSSGNTELDGAFLAVVRVAAPFAALPAVYTGSTQSFTLPMASRFRKGDFHGMKPLRPLPGDF